MSHKAIDLADPEFRLWLATKGRPLGGADLGGPGWQAGFEGGVSPGDQGVNVFSTYAQTGLTDIVRRELTTAWETIPDMGDQIAPLKPVYDRRIKRETAEVAAFGIGQFRAPNATPKVFNHKLTYTEEVMSLLLLEEIAPIDEDLWLRMTSPVEAIRARAGLDLTTLGKIMQIRNERLTEVMRWQVFKGNPVVVNYDDGQAQTITYNYLGNHKPTAGVAWTDAVNSTPIDDMIAWQQIVGNDVGVWGSRFHMNTNTFRVLQRANQPRGYLTPTDRNVYLPDVASITTLLLGGSGMPSGVGAGKPAESPQIIISDAGFRVESQNYNRGQNAMTKYLLDGEVMLTTPYVFEGEPIADVADGMVAVAQNWNALKWLQGAQTELMVDGHTKLTVLRQASARVVRLRRPGAFLLAKCY